MEKLIFLKNSVRYFDSGEIIAAKRQEWDIIRALLWSKTLHWMDGFLIFESWRTREQKRDYLDRFMVIANRASNVLKEIGLGAKVKSIKGSGGYWEINFAAKRNRDTNIEEAVKLLNKSRELFVLNNDSGWELVAKAMEDCPAPKNIVQSVICANSLPSNMELYKEVLGKIKTLMEGYRKILAEAVLRVANKASSDEKQGITFKEASIPLARWIIEILDVNEVMDLFEGKVVLPPSSIDEDIAYFIRLLVQLAEYSSEAPADSFAEEHEKSILLKNLSESDFVKQITESVAEFFEETKELGIERADVYNLLNSAIFEFAHEYGSRLEISKNIEGFFHRYLRHYVRRRKKGGDILHRICTSQTLTDHEKKEQLLSVLKQIKGADSIRASTIAKIANVIHGTKYSAPPESQVKRFQTVEEALEVKNLSPPEWFRPLGPVFSDFEDQRVYRRRVIDELKEKVYTKLFYLIEGGAATGKSVIVRHMMYESFKKDPASKVYHFDIAQKRYFDVDQLIKDIQSTSGVFIIENIHLDPYKIYWIYTKIKNDPDRFAGRHMLFTSRTLQKELQDEHSNALLEIDKLNIKPFEEAWELIEFYCSHSTTPKIVSKMYHQIMSISSKSFWLLAFALQGCANADGKGEPISWIGDKVNEYLYNLENLDERYDKYSDYYPRILLALCPLYKGETLTSESFLIKELQFPGPAIKALTKRGEITRQEDENKNIFYGLPHSTLAQAYWEYGRTYRKYLPEYSDFIHDYVISNMPNGMKALITAQEDVYSELSFLLYENKQLAEIIENEPSIEVIKDWVSLGDWFDYDDSTIEVLAKKVALTNKYRILGELLAQIIRPDPSEECWGPGKTFWKLLDKQKLATSISDFKEPSSILYCLWCLGEANSKYATKILALMNIKELAFHLNDFTNAIDSCKWIGFLITFTNKGTWRKFWTSFDKKLFSKKVEKTANLYDSIREVVYVYKTNESVGYALWKSLNLEQIAQRLVEKEDFGVISGFVDCLSEVDKKLWHEIWAYVDLNRLAQRMNNTNKARGCFLLTISILRIDAEKGGALWKLLDIKKIATQFNCEVSDEEILHLVIDLYKLSKTLGNELWPHLDKKKLFHLLKRTANNEGAFSHIFDVFESLSHADSRVVRFIWNPFIIRPMINNLNSLDDLDVEEAYYKISDMCNFDNRYREEFFQELDLEKLCRMVEQYENIESSCKLIGAMFKMSEKIGWQVWEMLDLEKLASKLRTSKEWYSETDCFLIIYKYSIKAASRLWYFLDQTEILNRLYSMDTGPIEEFLSAIYKIDQKAGRDMRNLVEKQRPDVRTGKLFG